MTDLETSNQPTREPDQKCPPAGANFLLNVFGSPEAVEQVRVGLASLFLAPHEMNKPAQHPVTPEKPQTESPPAMTGLETSNEPTRDPDQVDYLCAKIIPLLKGVCLGDAREALRRISGGLHWTERRVREAAVKPYVITGSEQGINEWSEL